MKLLALLVVALLGGNPIIDGAQIDGVSIGGVVPPAGPDCDLSELSVTTGLTTGFIACDTNWNDADPKTWTDVVGSNDLSDFAGGAWGPASYTNEATSTLTNSCGEVTFNGTNQALNFASPITGDDMTMCAVVKINDGATSNRMLITRDSGSAAQWRFLNDEKQDFSVGGVAAIGTSTSAVPTGSAQRICVRYDRAGDIDAAGTVKFYLNGTADGSTTNAQTFADGINSMGQRAAAFYYEGSVVVFLKYNDALSDADIGTINTWMSNACD